MKGLIHREEGKKIFTFVSIEDSKKAIEDGFKGPFYGRYALNSIFKDPVLFGSFPHPLKTLRTWKEFPEDGCIPLATLDQYNEFYKK